MPLGVPPIEKESETGGRAPVGRAPVGRGAYITYSTHSTYSTYCRGGGDFPTTLVRLERYSQLKSQLSDILREDYIQLLFIV